MKVMITFRLIPISSCKSTEIFIATPGNFGGRFKNSDNIIAEIHSDGTQSTRFQALPAFQTPEAIEDLCEEFNMRSVEILMTL